MSPIQLTSAAVAPSATSALLSPPRRWPTSFKDNVELQRFLKLLKGKRVRATSLPPVEVQSEAASVSYIAGDDATNAQRVFEALGWTVMHGFAIFESEVEPNIFVAKQHSWNLHPRNIWVDLTPRDAAHAEMVLVECDVQAAHARTSEAQGGLINKKVASQVEEEVMTVLPAADANASEETEAPATGAEGAVAELSYEEALARISLGPKASKRGGRRRQAAVPEDDIEFTARSGTKAVLYGEPSNPKKKSVPWPPKNSKVRLRIKPDETELVAGRECRAFDLEARCWGAAAWRGKEDGEDADLMAELYGGEVEWFAPPEYGDKEAALLKVTGHLIEGDSKSVRLRIATVDEQRNGTRMPPLCADDFYNLCGKSLLNAVEASWHGGQQLNLTLDRRTDWVVSLIKDS